MNHMLILTALAGANQNQPSERFGLFIASRVIYAEYSKLYNSKWPKVVFNLRLGQLPRVDLEYRTS